MQHSYQLARAEDGDVSPIRSGPSACAEDTRDSRSDHLRPPSVFTVKCDCATRQELRPDGGEGYLRRFLEVLDRVLWRRSSNALSEVV